MIQKEEMQQNNHLKSTKIRHFLCFSPECFVFLLLRLLQFLFYFCGWMPFTSSWNVWLSFRLCQQIMISILIWMFFFLFFLSLSSQFLWYIEECANACPSHLATQSLGRIWKRKQQQTISNRNWWLCVVVGPVFVCAHCGCFYKCCVKLVFVDYSAK